MGSESRTWREALLDGVLLVTGGLGTLAVLLLALGSDWIPPQDKLVLALLIGGNVSLAIGRPLGYELRARGMLVVFAAASLFLVARQGHSASSAWTALATVVLGGLFYGRRGGGALLLLVGGAWPLCAWLQGQGLLAAPIAPPRGTLTAGLGQSLSFVTLGGGLLLSTLYAVDAVERARRRAELALEQLRAEERARIAAKEELDRTQRALEQAQMLDVVGQLAGGAAHDINNALVVIQCWTDLLRAELPAGESSAEGWEAIAQATANCSRMTRYLLTLGRRDVYAPERLELGAAIERELPSLRRLLPARIAIECRVEERGRVLADPGQVQQVLLNLCLNARDAMPEGGTLGITLRAAEGDQLCLEVRDTGAGIDPAVAARLFEPFVTTKGKQGTGLGLAMVKTIAERAGGRVEVESQVGEGATFRLYVPRSASAADTPEPAADSDLGAVLVVEDDPGVRDLLERTLRRSAREVLAAGDAAEALTLLRRYQGQLDALVTDGLMPGPPLSQLIEGFCEHHPQGRVLVCSGYVEDERVRAAVGRGGVAFLAKPFSPAELQAALARAGQLEPALPLGG